MERLRTRRNWWRLKAWDRAWGGGVIGLVSPKRRAIQGLPWRLRRFGGSWFWGWLGGHRSLILRGVRGVGCHPRKDWLFRGWIAGFLGSLGIQAPGELSKHGMLVIQLLLK
jgi:hypothetical protein